MRILSLTAIAIVTLILPVRTAAQGPSPLGPVSPPFSKLFGAPARPQTQSNRATPFAPLSPPAALTQRRPPMVVCGMTIVPVDPALDPKITHPVPGTGTRFTLKTIKPPACAP